MCTLSTSPASLAISLLVVVGMSVSLGIEAINTIAELI